MTIPPVVARIFSGDSTSPLTREASVMAQSKGWCGFGKGGAERGVAVQFLRLDGKKFAT